MTEESNRQSIFSDRRQGQERRKQRLPMPSGLDRRANRPCRRDHQFLSQPWWLRINYAAELVSETTVIERTFGKQLEKSGKSRRQSKPKPPRT